ncbi:MAG: hypothetical protein U0T74_08635 [Chitinophagales bacterium]
MKNKLFPSTTIVALALKKTTGSSIKTLKKKKDLSVTFTTTCNFISGTSQWDITDANGNPDPSKITFAVVKETLDPYPYVKIFHNGTEVQCIPAGNKRLWKVYYNSRNSKWYFKDALSTATLTPCSGPRFCLAYTNHEDKFALKLDKSTDTIPVVIFIGTDDYRNGISTDLNDHVFNIHNATDVNTKSVHVVMQATSGLANYSFTIMHNSNQPTTLNQCSGGSAPDTACYKAH